MDISASVMDISGSVLGIVVLLWIKWVCNGYYIGSVVGIMGLY